MYKTLFCFLILLFLFPFTVEAFVFSRNLTIGSVGIDVLELQKILNSDPDTVLTNSGAGSPGNETQYFGPITKNALTKFQNKFRSEILVPVGLSFGTGYFGPSTIKKINKLNTGYVSAVGNSDRIQTKTLELQQENTIKQSNFSFSLSKQSKIFIVSPQKLVLDYGEINLFGEGFKSVSEVVINGVSNNLLIPEIKSDSEISLKIPSSFVGPLKIGFKSKDGLQSNTVPVFIGANNLQTSPKITKVSSKVVSWGDEIFVYGNNFTEKNIVVLPHGVLFDVNSKDGNSLSFVLQNHFNSSVKTNLNVPFYILIMNKNGVSEYYNDVQLSI